MKTMRLLPAIAAGLTLSACFGGSDKPDALLDLTPTAVRTTAVDKTVPAAQVVVVALPTVPEELGVMRIPVRTGAAFTYLKGAQWVSKPSILFSRLVTETLAAGGRVVLDPGETVFQAGTVLTGHLPSFGVDADRREAVVVYDAALAAPDNSLRSRRFEARVPLAAIDPATVVPALNQAANKVAADVAGWLGS